MSEKEKEKRPSLLYRVGEDWPADDVPVKLSVPTPVGEL